MGACCVISQQALTLWKNRGAGTRGRAVRAPAAGAAGRDISKRQVPSPAHKGLPGYA